MANEKQINVRMQMKHDIEANWYTAGTATKPFIPKAGELIVYEPDNNYDVRTKIGNGETPVHLLPWVSGCNESVGLSFASNDDGTCYVQNIGQCNDTDIIIPKYSPAGEKVTSIGEFAFLAQNSITSVTIPSSVKRLENEAFSECENLTTVIFEEGLTYIGHGALTSTGILSINIPNSVVEIDGYAFASCPNLSSVIIGNSVAEIGDEAFSACESLKYIVIPKSVTTIYQTSFESCISLTDIYYEGSQEQWEEISNGHDLNLNDNTIVHYNYANDFISVNEKIDSLETGIPSYDSTADNGKFFRIENGVAGWYSVPNAEDYEF